MNKEIFEILASIPDPEIPVISITDLGIVRDVRLVDGKVEVDITPTYSGCPAMKMIEDQIALTLKDKGFTEVRINLVYTPAWTTDWLSVEAKERLKSYGISPPETLMQIGSKVCCPRCGSKKTNLTSVFGATACKSLYVCGDCKEPFEHFKAH
jgi:ring-1,2-phenylacetyl-CoA epoxidase subunit PaaD